MNLENRVKRLEMQAEKTAGIFGGGEVYVITRESPDVSEEEAKARYFAETRKTPARTDGFIIINVCRSREDVEKYNTEKRPKEVEFVKR